MLSVELGRAAQEIEAGKKSKSKQQISRMEESRIGYHFTPTDVEMLMILRLKAEGKSLCSNIIERNIYGDGDECSPWKIFKEDDPWEIVVDTDSTKSSKDVKFLYVITKLIRISELKTCRVAGCGTWDGQTGRSYIKFKDKKIGFKKMFNFRAKTATKSCGNWIMHEYHLDGDFLKGVSNDYVICRIKRIDSRTSPGKSSCTVDSGTETSNVQEYQECTTSVQESAKRKYPSTLHEEETSCESKLFKHRRAEDNLKDPSDTTVGAARDESSREFAADHMTNLFPELPELAPMMNWRADNDASRGLQYDELEEFTELSSQQMKDLFDLLNE